MTLALILNAPGAVHFAKCVLAYKFRKYLCAVGSSPSLRAKRRLSAVHLYFHLALRLALWCYCATARLSLRDLRARSNEAQQQYSSVSHPNSYAKEAKDVSRHDACLFWQR